jgi:hypothetical protein
MAPEQARGEEVDARCDLFSLGVVLYEMSAGVLPFQGKDTLALLHALATQEPVPVRQLRADLPAALAALIGRLLSKDPAGRPGSAGEVAGVLQAVERGVPGAMGTLPAGAPVGAAANGPAGAGGRLWTRRRVLLAGTGGLVALAGGLAWWGPLIDRRPLKGFIDVEMTRPGDPARQMIPLGDPAARPLRAGDEVRVLVDLNRGAYLYVLWIDTRGRALPVYPWVGGDWDRRARERPVARLRLPEKDGGWGWWTVDPGPAGLETLVLLARETPLPAGVDLKAELAGLGAQPPADREGLAVAWFENGEVVRDEPQRAANLKAVLAGSNPLERVNQEVQRRLAGTFTYTRAVTFANLGDQKGP